MDKRHKDVVSLLFPEDATSETADENRWRRVSTWLTNPPKGQRNKRLYCLFLLRNTRQYHFSNKKLWGLRIAELQYLLELYPTLPRLIRVNLGYSKSSWLVNLTLTVMAQLETTPDLTNQRETAILLEAERFSNQALGELRKGCQIGMLATHQRASAQICVMKGAG
jgi:hypothetical protein